MLLQLGETTANLPATSHYSQFRLANIHAFRVKLAAENNSRQ